MLFEDNEGVLLTADEVDELSIWEIEERSIHVAPCYDTDLMEIQQIPAQDDSPIIDDTELIDRSTEQLDRKGLIV